MDFVVRRWRRIFPPYWCFLIITGMMTPAVLQVTTGEDPWWPELVTLSIRQWAGTITLTETWLHHFFGETNWKLAWGHAWTLCYEEQFYLVSALALWIGRKRFFPVIAGITLPVLVTTCFTFKDIGFPTQGFFFDGYWLLFAAGVYVFWLSSEARGQIKAWGAPLLPAAFFFAVVVNLCVIPNLRITDHALHLSYSLAFGFGFAGLIQLLKPYDSWLAEQRTTWPIAWVGKRCYSVYLVHVPVVYLVASLFPNTVNRSGKLMLWCITPLSIFGTFVVALVFYNGIEKRFLSSRSVA